MSKNSSPRRQFALFKSFTVKCGTLDGAVKPVDEWRQMGEQTFATRSEARVSFLVGMKELPEGTPPGAHADRVFVPVARACGVKVGFAA